ncbi:Leucine-rich repeat-containing protein 57 [Balamuthia mandrillaris]
MLLQAFRMLSFMRYSAGQQANHRLQVRATIARESLGSMLNMKVRSSSGSRPPGIISGSPWWSCSSSSAQSSGSVLLHSWLWSFFLLCSFAQKRSWAKWPPRCKLFEIYNFSHKGNKAATFPTRKPGPFLPCSSFLPLLCTQFDSHRIQSSGFCLRKTVWRHNHVCWATAQALELSYLTALNLEKNGLENKHLSPFLEAFQLPTSQSASRPHKPNRTVVLLDTHGIQSSSKKSLKTLQDCLTRNYNYLKAKKDLKDDWKKKEEKEGKEKTRAARMIAMTRRLQRKTAFAPTTASKIARKKKGVTLARARKFNTLQATSNKEEEEEEDGVDEDRESFQDSFPVGSFPNLSRLLHLRFLYLPFNALKDIPTSLFDLRALQTLDPSFNELTCLPEEIGLRSQPENLWLCGNDLQYLPVGLCRLPALSELLVEDNPLRTIPNEVLSNGQQAILAYFRELKGDMVRVGSRVWSASSDKTIRVGNDLSCLQPLHFVQEITEAHQDATSALIPISDEDDPKLEPWRASWDHTIHVWTDRALPSPLETEPTEVVVEVDLLSNNDKKNYKHKNND